MRRRRPSTCRAAAAAAPAHARRRPARRMHFDVRLLQRVPCAFLPLARIARLRPSRFRLTVPNPARRRGRVADACVLLALIRNGANAPAFSDAPPFALQRRVCAAGIVTASCAAASAW